MLPGIALLPTPITAKHVSDYGLAVKGNAIQVFQTDLGENVLIKIPAAEVIYPENDSSLGLAN